MGNYQRNDNKNADEIKKNTLRVISVWQVGTPTTISARLNFETYVDRWDSAMLPGVPRRTVAVIRCDPIHAGALFAAGIHGAFVNIYFATIACNVTETETL